MRIFSLLFILFLSACTSTKQTEQAEQPKTCDLAYSRYQATVTGYCQEAVADLLESVPTIEKEIEIRAVDEIPELFWYSRLMKYSLVKQDNKAPMAFVIAGTGASYKSAKMIALQKILYQQGYHVLSISSPTFSNYIINATTNNDVPGDLSRDADTLYTVMQQVLKQVQEEDDVEVSGFSLTGYSLGGAHSAFISLLDEEKKVFNFEKVVLINPPVSLYNSVSVLDSYLDLKNDRHAVIGMYEKVFDRFSEGYANQESSSLTEGSIYSLFKDAQLTDEELKLLIGTSFRLSSTDMMFAIDVTYNLGAFIYKNHDISKFESITHSMQRAGDATFTQYFEKAMVPWSQKHDPSVTRESLIEKLSLRSIEDYLKNSEKITMVTNADDIILIEGEVEYLQGVFQERAKIFERGGHCGNMDRVSFVDYMRGQFQGVNL